MANRIRLGFVGANVNSRWAGKSHFPALRAHPDMELTAVCTTNPASAAEARKALGARLAFSDYREMAASPEIDAVAVVVRVPSHYGPAKAALEAGKHVLCEWPLGLNTGEAEELAALARAKGLQTAVGLQARMSPHMNYMRELVESGYVGDVLTCNAVMFRLGGGAMERNSSHAWHADAALGANPLTIGCGHVTDSLRFVAGDFAKLSGMCATRIKQWQETDTRKIVNVTAPDNVVACGELRSGAVVSIQVGTLPWAPSGYRMEIYGSKGTLKITGEHCPHHDILTLHGVQGGQSVQLLEPPERYYYVPKDYPRGIPFNIGQMYARFAQAIRTGKAPDSMPTFAIGAEVHHIIDGIKRASDSGRTQPTSSREAAAA